MATAFAEPTQIAGTDIVATVTQNPGLVLLDQQKFSAWYESLKAKAPTDADVTTRKGREALRSYAAEVRSEKAAIDKARLRLTKEWRDMTAQANAAGKVIDAQLESLAAEVRRPLTEWEEAEKARVADCQAVIAGFKDAATVSLEDTAATVRERGGKVRATVLDAERFGELLPEAAAAKEQTVSVLRAAMARLEKEEADRAELARLRAEAEARAEADRVAAAKAEAERKEAARIQAERVAAEEAERRRIEEARQAEERRVVAERAEAERVERARQEAAEAAQREAERAAQAERDRIQREHDEALATERRAREEAERAAQAERDRIAREEAARVAEEQRVAAEQAKRERNRAHRAKIMGEAKVAIMASGGIDEDAAVKIVKAIAAGKVPHVSVGF